ncbi:MAG: fumarylacetoacetate hydrolase family protein [Spirosomaceae bacterium]|jgi:2,4-didehydro-3-deoxy-L-rhamnonate hydrolase|nr:fumarylacetoacetate hydrolase family protein [Spirosomataceae bacterium]
MKLYTFSFQNQTKIGAKVEGRLADLTALLGIKTMTELIEKYDTLPITKAIDNASADKFFDFEEVEIKMPVTPQTVWCSGLNYKSHVLENPNAKFLSEPRFFAKLPNSLIGPNEAILHPGDAFQVDYEVEFAVVLGKTASRLTEPNAMEHIFGYTILHDVGARYIQFKDNNEMMGKNFDTFCPIGPCIVTKDEIPDPTQVRLRTRLNGQLMQDGCNDEWLFSLPHLLSWLTMACTLRAGDIVSTGTPMGIGFFRNPQVFLKDGDVVELEIPEIGKLVNPVVAASYHR